MEDLRLIYDFADRLPRIRVMLYPLLFVAFGLAVFLYNKRNISKNEALKFEVSQRKSWMLFGILFACLAGIFCAIVIPSNVREYLKTKNVYDSRKYNVVEGKVELYHPMPEGGHDAEKFTVRGVTFEYSDYDLSDYGYNNAASKGGVIRQGLYVRVAYFNNEDKNVILRLETK